MGACRTVNVASLFSCPFSCYYERDEIASSFTTNASLSTACWKARPPTLSQKGDRIVSPHGRDINTFVAACGTLLGTNIMTAELTEQEGQLIQYYIAALATKFPALVE